MSDLSPTNSESKPHYVLITPIRDEENYIGPLIESIVAQDIRPAKWVIVDDGSRDKTPEIVEAYGGQWPFIELVKLPRRQDRAVGGEAAITHALRRIKLSDYDFLARFDGDLLF